MCALQVLYCIFYLTYKSGRQAGRKEEKPREGRKRSTAIPGRPGFQHAAKTPVPRPFCKWWAEGHRGLAMAAETERRGGGRHAPVFALPPQASTLGARKVGLQSHVYWLCDFRHGLCLLWASGFSPGKCGPSSQRTVKTETLAAPP